MPHRQMSSGEVAERSIAAGCKPAAFGLRRFEPSPPHQPLSPWHERPVGWRRYLFGGKRASRGGEEWGRFKGWRTGRERREHLGGSNSVVESQPSKLLVAGSIPVSRSTLM